MQEPKLGVHEWLAVVTIISTLLILTMIALISNQHSFMTILDTPYEMQNQELVVFIEGAVERPGRQIVKEGSLIKDALEIAKPLPEADLKKIKKTSKIRNGQVLKVPYKKNTKKKISVVK